MFSKKEIVILLKSVILPAAMPALLTVGFPDYISSSRNNWLIFIKALSNFLSQEVPFG